MGVKNEEKTKEGKMKEKAEIVRLATVEKYRDKDAKAPIVNQFLDIIKLLSISMIGEVVSDAAASATKSATNIQLEQELKDAKQKIVNLEKELKDMEWRDKEISSFFEAMFDLFLEPKIKTMVRGEIKSHSYHY